jgi:DNA-binding response OmpR family regulator
MDNRRTVLICDNDYAFLNEMEKSLANEGYDVDTIDNAADLIPSAIRLQPHVIIVNPDMQAFNEYDVCKHIIKEQRIQVILVLDPHSVTRAQIGDCSVEDVITKPVEIKLLANLLAKHISVNQ